jgi:hypothetical protein
LKNRWGVLFVRLLQHHGALRLPQILRPRVTFGLRWENSAYGCKDTVG